MKYSNYKYIDYAYGGVQNRNNVVDISELSDPSGVDCYRTLFRYDDKYLTHFTQKKSVAGYSGFGYADYLPFDFDSENVADALKDVCDFAFSLKVDYDYELCYVYFSGCKGFHVLIPSACFGYFEPTQDLPVIMKTIALDLGQDLKTLDTSIYNQNRLFRLRNTKHSKSGLYKIPVMISDLNKGLDHILKLAKKQQEDNFPQLDDNLSNEQFVEIYQKYKNTKSKSLMVTKNLVIEDFKTGSVKGDRNNAGMRIAGLLKSKTIDKELAFIMLDSWNRLNDPPMSTPELENIIHSAFKGVEPDIKDDIKLIWQIADEYQEYVRSPAKVHIGIQTINKAIRGIRPGQVMTIIGFTGNFKSGLLQWIMRHHTKTTKEPVLLFELEMSDIDVFERAAQMSNEMTGNEVERLFQGDTSHKLDIVKNVKKEQENFLIVTNPCLNLEEMENHVLKAEEMLGLKIGLIGIDFIQLMDEKGGTNVERVDKIAKNIKIFAKKMNIPVIAVSQVTDVKDESKNVGLMDARDSKTIVQMADFVLGLYLQPDSKDIQNIELLKNRKGKKVKTRVKINRDVFKFEEIEEPVNFED